MSKGARGGDDPLIALNPAPASDAALVSPLGELVFSQRSAPLNLQLQRFGSVKLRHPTTATIEPTDEDIKRGDPEPDYFAPGTYLDLSLAEAMNQPAFDRLDAGFELNFEPGSAQGKDKHVEYKEFYRGRPLSIKGSLHLFDAGVLGLMGGRRAAPGVKDRSPLVTVSDEAWVTHSVGGSATVATSRTAAHVTVRRGQADVALAQADTPVSLAGVI